MFLKGKEGKTRFHEHVIFTLKDGKEDQWVMRLVTEKYGRSQLPVLQLCSYYKTQRENVLSVCAGRRSSSCPLCFRTVSNFHTLNRLAVYMWLGALQKWTKPTEQRWSRSADDSKHPYLETLKLPESPSLHGDWLSWKKKNNRSFHETYLHCNDVLGMLWPTTCSWTPIPISPS